MPELTRRDGETSRSNLHRHRSCQSRGRGSVTDGTPDPPPAKQLKGRSLLLRHRRPGTFPRTMRGFSTVPAVEMRRLSWMTYGPVACVGLEGVGQDPPLVQVDTATEKVPISPDTFVGGGDRNSLLSPRDPIADCTETLDVAGRSGGQVRRPSNPDVTRPHQLRGPLGTRSSRGDFY